MKQIVFEFHERSEPVFEGACGAETREGNGVGGYLQATATKAGARPMIGTSISEFDGTRYTRLTVRLRKEGRTAASLEANGVALRNHAGSTGLDDDFALYEAIFPERPAGARAGGSACNGEAGHRPRRKASAFSSTGSRSCRHPL